MLRLISKLPFAGWAAFPDIDPDLSVALLISGFGLDCAALLIHAGVPLDVLCDALLR
jgi:hypothetical protein